MKKLYLLICFVISTTLLADSKKNSKANYLEQIKFIKNNNLIKNNSNIKAFYLFRSYSREIIITNKGLIFHYFNWKKNRYDRIDLEFINAEINEENFINAGKTIPISYYMSNKNVETFSTEMLVVKNIYPNIDWKLYFDEEGNFKYDFVVYPGGDAGKICWRYKFANTKLNDNEILVKSMEASHYENIPLAYLNNNNEHINVEYIQNKNHYFTFKIDRSYEKDTLIIDPVVVWATNYGGSNTDIVTDLEFDGTYLWVTGYTASANFPTLNPGSGSYYQGSLSGSNDIFLLQFDNMQNLVWATFLGGTGNDQANALSQQGNYIFLTGSTTSTNTFPTVNPGGSAYFDGTNGGATDAFVCRFNKTTRQLEWNTFYGGNNNDIAYDVFYDNYNIYVCGRTWSGNLTTVDPGGGAYFQGTKDDQSDGFILKFGNNLGLKWATYYGKGTSSNNEDYLYKIFSDTITVWIAGAATSPNWTLVNPGGGAYFDNTHAGAADLLLNRFDSSGVRTWATYYGGGNSEVALSVYKNGNKIYFCGRTQSGGFYTTPGAFQNSLSGGQDAFILVFDYNSVALLYSTFIGGTSNDEALDLKPWGNGIAIVGVTSSNNFPTINPGGNNYFDNTFGGISDGFLITMDNTYNFTWSTFIGGNGDDGLNAIYTTNNAIWLGGYSGDNTILQQSMGGTSYLQAFGGGTYDGYLVKLYECASNFLSTSYNSPLCEGSNLNLTANTGFYFNWTGPAGFTSTLQNPVISNIQTSQSGNYILEVIDQNGCRDTDTVVVNVNPLPTVTASSNSPICEGQTLNLSVNTTSGATYSWSGPNGFTSTQQNPSIANATTAASGTYTVTVTGANGCSNSGSVSVTVNPLPTVTASSNSPICEGQTLNLSVNTTSGATYSWSGPNGFTSTQQNPSIANATTAASGTYTVTVTGANGCSNSGSVSVTVNPLPTVTASSNSPICEGQTLNLSVNTTSGATYSWSGPNGFTSTQQNPSIANATTTASGTYTVTVTGPNGCSNSGSVSVTVNPLPTVTASSNSPICEGQTLNLSVNTTSGATYSWNGPNGFTSTQQNPSIANATTTASGTYTVTVTGTNGCSNSGSVSVTVNPLPTVTASSNSPICEGQTLNLSVNTTSGATYSWSGPNGFTSTQQNPSIANATTTASGTYTVTVTGPNGCSNSGSVSVTVNPLPTVTASSNSPICEGQTLNLSVNTTSGATYSWSGPNGFTSTQQNPTITNATTNASGTYTVMVTGPNGCSNSGSVNVIINPKPVITITPDTVICEGDTITLTAGGGMSYLWNNGSTTSSITVSPGTTTTYQVVVTNAAGCQDSAEVVVTVNPPPIAQISGDNEICQGEKTKLTASGGNSYLWNNGNTSSIIEVSPTQTTTYQVIVSSGNCKDTAVITIVVHSLPIIKAGNDTTINQYGEAYLWADGGVYYSWDPTIGLSCDTCKETVARPEQTTQYCVTVTDSNGCENKSCVLVIVEYECGEIFVPNVFSPNGDGSNDYLFVYGNCIKDFLWEIYNRWGERVFLTNNPQQSWDGTYRGQSVNGGVYHYRLKVVLKNDQIIEKKGTITLVK